jgi:endoglucanase
MNKERLQLLRELTEVSGVSGYETEVKNVLKKYLKGLADVTYDKIGSIVFRKEGESSTPKVMIPGHMDEIGFMVRFITDDGFIKFWPLGGWFDQVLLSQKVVIKSSKGDIIGIIGSKPPHILTEEERKKVIEIKDMFIDIGASSKKEVEEDFGIKPGDPIIPFSEFKEMWNKKCLLAKAWDDRVGCALFVEVIKELQKVKHPNTVYGVGTVQEEVGLRGARTSSWVVEPDVAIIAEVGIASDVPGAKPEEICGKLGKGPQIAIYDAGMIPNLKLRDLVVDIAKKKKIPFQFTSLNRGATDGGVIHIHTKGVPCVYIGVPTRYIHSHAGIINIDDYENTLKLIVETVKVLDKKKVEELIP